MDAAKPAEAPADSVSINGRPLTLVRCIAYYEPRTERSILVLQQPVCVPD
jgi:hypothetical protein